MKRLVVIGANDFQNQLILKAKALGYETHVFAWECGDVGEKTADYFYPVSIIEKEKILEKCREIKPCGVCSIASDLATLTTNYVAEGLGLRGNSPRCTHISTNKYAMREAFRNCGIRVPAFRVLDESTRLSELTDFPLPCIIKPTDRSGSRAITKLTDYSTMEQAINNAIGESFEKKAIIEEFIEGDEYSCECVSSNGRHHFLALTKKFTTGAPAFIETGHIEPSGISDAAIQKIIPEIFAALDALEITDGASHSEFKLDKNGDANIIEIGARMGGDCIGSDLVFLSTGYDFLKMVIDAACGNELDFTRHEHPGYAAIKFIFGSDDLDALERQKKEDSSAIYRVSDICRENLGNAKDSSSRAGYYILIGGDYESLYNRITNHNGR